jgi:outer membrane protein OmpA-like peptidoglycan-associated protein
MTARLLLFLALSLFVAGCATQPGGAPAETIPDLYTVYFNFDSAALNDDTQPIIRQAAANAKRARPARIEIAGYTGQEADARTDDRLAAQRFATVEQALVAEGIDRTLLARTALVDPIPLPATAVRRIEIRFVGQAPP